MKFPSFENKSIFFINNDLEIHRQVKTSDIISRRFMLFLCKRFLLFLTINMHGRHENLVGSTSV